MSIYQQYDRLFYWNKTTNIQLLNNVLQSYKYLSTEYKIKSNKRKDMNRQNKHKIIANRIFFDVLLSLHNKYPQFDSLSLDSSMIDKHCKRIQEQIDDRTNQDELQKKIEEKIEEIIRDKLAENHKKNREFYYTPSFTVKQNDIKSKQKIYLQSFVCMINIFSSQCVFRLMTNSTHIEKNTKNMQIKDVLVCYYGQEQNKKMGIRIKLDTGFGSGVQEYWIVRGEKDNETQFSCFVKLLFVLYTVSVSSLMMGDELRGVIEKAEKEMFKQFQDMLPAALGYLQMNSLYAAYVYLGQYK